MLLSNGECLHECSQTNKESPESCQTSNQKESKVETAVSSPFVTDNELMLTPDTVTGEENTTSVKVEQKPFTATENTTQEASMINSIHADAKSMLPSAIQEQFDDIPLEEKKIAKENEHETISAALISDVTTLSTVNSQSDKNSSNSMIVDIAKKKKKKKKWDIPITVFSISFYLFFITLQVDVICLVKICTF